MPRFNYYQLTGFPFIADESSVKTNPGIMIDWDLIPASYQAGAKQVSVNGAVTKGATSITVDALPVDLPLDTELLFGSWAPVTVHVNDSSISAGDTSITVTALTGPIPAGTTLDFGGGTNAQVVVLSADAASGDTTITIEPADGTVANSSTATFPGGVIVAHVAAAAAAGATTVTVNAVPFAIADNAIAYVSDDVMTGPKFIPAGTPLAKLSSGKRIPRALVTDSSTCSGILLANAEEEVLLSGNVGYTGYGEAVGGIFWENLMQGADPDTGLLPSDWKTELRANGLGYVFNQYADSREDGAIAWQASL